MYDTIYMVNLLLLKNGQVKSTALRLHKNRGSEEPKTRNFSTIDTVYGKKLFGIQEQEAILEKVNLILEILCEVLV